MPPRTPSQTVGPFFTIGLSGRPQSELVAPGSEGSVEVVGHVLDGAGDGVPDGIVEMWQTDASGEYRDGFGWGRCGTSGDGSYRFLTVKPGQVANDQEGPQAPHLNMLVFARGLLKPVYTRMYFPDEEAANRQDPVLSALDDADRAALTASAEDGRLRFDIRLQGDRQTPFFAL